MPRIRSIHPSTFTDEEVMRLTVECPLAFIALQGLWCEADDSGVFEWKPLTLKARILPATAINFDDMLSALLAGKFILTYEVGGKKYGAVRNFCRFQRPKKPNRVHPLTREVEEWVCIKERDGGTSSPPVPHQFPTGGEKAPQMEDGGGKEKPEAKASGKKSRPKTPIDPNWQPDDDLRAYARERGIVADDFRNEFINHWISDGGRKADWNATFRKRCDQLVIWRAKRAQSPGQRSSPQGGGGVVRAAMAVIAANRERGIRPDGVPGDGPTDLDGAGGDSFAFESFDAAGRPGPSDAGINEMPAGHEVTRKAG